MPPRSTPPRRTFPWPELMLLLVAVVWGSSYGVVKIALAYYPVLAFLALRFLTTGALLSPALLAASPSARGESLRLGLRIGGVLSLIFLCETYGVAHTRAANAAFLISLSIVLTPFAEWWLLGRRPQRRALACVAVSLLGASLISGTVDLSPGIGDLLILAAALLRAIIVCLISRWTQHRPFNAMALTAVQSTVIGGTCLVLALVGGNLALPPLPGQATFWYATGYLVLGCTVFAFMAYNWALRHTAPTRVALLTGSEPVFGALFAALWLGEKLTAQAWLGGALIVLAASWAVLATKPAR